MSLEAILQALGAKDENEGLRNAMSTASLLTDLMTATGARTVEDALNVVRGTVKLIGALESLTGKKGDESVGVATAWKGSHEQLPAVQTQLTEATGKLQTFEIETMITKAKLDNKLTPDGEKKLRVQLADGTFSIKQGAAMLDMMHPIPALENAARLQPPGQTPVQNGAPPPVLVDPSKKYEDYTPDEMGSMRQSGAIDKNTYATLRTQWIADGRPTPAVKKSAA